MNTSTISKKEYRDLLKRQKLADGEISRLKKIVLELARDEIKPAIAKKLAEQSSLLDQKRGRGFSTARGFKAYLRNL